MPTNIGPQIKTHGIRLVDNGTTGFFVARTDTGAGADVGAIHMAVQGVVDTFTAPTGTDQHSQSLLARMTQTAAGVGVTCYGMSLDAIGPGTNHITFTKWTAGVPAILATFTATPARVAGQIWEFDASGGILTAKLNGTIVTATDPNGVAGKPVTFTDPSPIAAGQFFGCHALRTSTTSDFGWTKVLAFPIPAPVGGGGGGGGGGTGGVGSTRQAMLWPGDSTCAVNIPFGDGTTFSVRGINWGADDQFPQTSAFGMSIYGAGYTPIAQTSTEHHTVHVNGDQITAFDGYAGSDTSPTIKSDNYSLKTGNLGDGHQGMLAVGTTNTVTGVRGFGMGACAWLHVLGIVREADIRQAYIGHAVMFALTNADLSRSSQFVAPAWRADGDASLTYSTSGTFSIGMRLGIPWGTTKPTLTSTIGPLLWDALKTFGGFVSNRAGSGFCYFEATSQMATWKTEFINSGDIAKIKAAIGQATNVNSGNQFAGPITSARRPATLPPFV